MQARSSPGPRQQQAHAAFGVRIERLNKELSAKTRTIQELSRSLERLQRERSAPPASSRQPRAENRRTESRPPPGAATPPSCSPAAEESFPAAGCQKTYRPTLFTGRSAEGAAPPHRPAQALLPPPDSHISDVLQENQALKHRLELLELHGKQEKGALKVEVAQAREQLLR